MEVEGLDDVEPDVVPDWVLVRVDGYVDGVVDVLPEALLEVLPEPEAVAEVVPVPVALVEVSLVALLCVLDDPELDGVDVADDSRVSEDVPLEDVVGCDSEAPGRDALEVDCACSASVAAKSAAVLEVTNLRVFFI